jgi:hypothetical protein
MVTIELRTIDGGLLGLFDANLQNPPMTITWGAKHFIIEEFDDKCFKYIEADNMYILEGFNCRRVR